MVILNLLIAALLIGLVLVELAPTPIHALVIASAPLRLAFIAAVIGLLLVGIFLVLGKQLTRASVRGNAVLASTSEFPEIEAIKDEAVKLLGTRRSRQPEIYVTAGNGVLNAFAASTFGHDYVVVHSDLFANTFEQNQRALRFIVGHEIAHIRLAHTTFLYQLSIAYSGLVPFLGAWLSRLRELSCDRMGAHFEPDGADGLVLLTAGRYIYHEVQLKGLLEQAQRNRGFWNAVVQLPLSHPLTLKRIRELSRLGLISSPAASDAQPGKDPAKLRPTSA